MKLFVCLLFALTLPAQTPPHHPAWNGDKVHDIRIRFSQPDYWEQLARNYLGTEQESAYLEGSLEWGDYRFASVGVRYKGNSSYRGATTRKKPFRIKLNEFVKGQKIEGIGAYNLSNAFGDPSMVREPLYYEMARAIGLKAPRTNYARLFINDEYIGLYVLGEVVNGDFLKNYFGRNEDTGNLYKGNIGASFAYLGEDKARYKEVWEKQTNEDADDWSDLIELCHLIGNTPAGELREKLEPLMDIDSVLLALALDNATVNLDSYVGLNQNFNIYRRPSDGRWVWVVWDPSLAFGGLTMGGVPLAELPTEYVQTGGLVMPGGGTTSGTRPLATKLWQVPEYRNRYRQIYKRLVEVIFNPATTIARANQLRDLIRPAVQADTQLLFTQAQFEAAMTAPIASGLPGGGNAPGLQTLINARTNWLKAQFAPQSHGAASLNVSPATLDFTMPAGGANPAPRSVTVSFGGVATPPTFSLTARTDTGNWLVPAITGGPLPASFQVAVDARTLPAGVYSGSISVYLGGAAEVLIPVQLTVAGAAAPLVSAVVDAASYRNAAIAPGQILTIFGSHLGAANTTSGVSVYFDGAPGHVLYVTPGQIGVTAPLSLAGKTQSGISVTFAGQTSPVRVQPVAATAPGLFTLNASGAGAVAAINQTGAVNTIQAPAARGSIVAFYLTGGGVTSAQGLLPGDTAVTIGGQPATVVYAGIAPGALQGLYQVNATIPLGLSAGAQPVMITVGGNASQPGVTVQVE